MTICCVLARDVRVFSIGAGSNGRNALSMTRCLTGPNLGHTGGWTRLVESDTVITCGIVLPVPEIMGGVPYVRGQAADDEFLRTDELRHTTKEIAATHMRSTLREGDILRCII